MTGLRRVVRLLLWMVGLCVLLVTLAVLWLRTDGGRASLAGWLSRQAAPWVDGELRVGRLDGSLWSGAVLTDVSVVRDNRVVLTIDRLDAAFDVRTFLGRRIQIESVTLTRPDLVLIEHATGWYVDGLQMPATPPGAPPPDRTLTVASVTVVDGHAEVRQQARRYDLVALDAEAGVSIASAIEVDVRRLTTSDAVSMLAVTSLSTRVRVTDAATILSPFVATTPGSRVEGRIEWTTDRHLRASLGSRAFTLAEFVSYVPAARGLDLRPSFELTLDGPLSALRVTGPIAESRAGEFRVDLITDLSGVFAARGRADLAEVDAARLWAEPLEQTALTGTVEFDVREDASGVTVGTFSAALPVAAYGAYRATDVRARGELSPEGGAADYSARAYGAPTSGRAVWRHGSDVIRAAGRARDVDVATLPAVLGLPAVSTAISGAYRVSLAGARWSLDADLEKSRVDTATIRAGTTVAIGADAQTIRYDVRGVVDALDPKALTATVTGEAGDWGVSDVRLAGPMHVSGRGPIASPIDHRLTFGGRLMAQVDGAVLNDMDVSGTLEARRLQAQAAGEVSGQWARVLRLESGGDVQPQGRITMALASADLSSPTAAAELRGSLEMELVDSTIQGLRLTRGRVSADVNTDVVTVRRLEAEGPAGRLSASGVFAVADAATHALTFSATIRDPRSVPVTWTEGVTGHVEIKGLVAGPSSAPELRGEWQASGIAGDRWSTLASSGTFELRVPDVDFARRVGRASAVVTGIEAGGQQLDRVALGADLMGSSTVVVANASHARGRLLMSARVDSADAERIRLTTTAFELGVQDRVWRLADGTTPLLIMTPRRFDLNGVDLVDGDARVTVSGGLPFEGAGTPSDDAVIIEAAGVAVAPLLTAVTGQGRIEGVLRGRVRITGDLSRPVVEAAFTVPDGRADGVPFQSLAGRMDVKDEVATVDLVLDAGERGSATVRGRAPLDPGAPGVDLAVIASLLDVGLVAPAVPSMANAGGAARLDVRVSGSLRAPVINGSLAASDVRFDVPETGVSYRRLTADVGVTDSILDVRAFSVEDQNGRPLTVVGRLDVVSDSTTAAVDLRIRARDFTVLMNEFGQVGVDVDLTAVGSLLAPRVLGQVSVVRGRFEVDRLLRAFVVDANPGVGPVPPPLYSGAAVSIDVRLPDNVVVRGRGLQTEEGPIGLGDINLTLGGTLQVLKMPSGQPALVGEVAAVRGTYEFQGRRFQIQRGSRLRFRGDDYTNPSLDITATREVSGVTVTVALGGTAAEPTIRLTSQPALDEGDILALVVFNRPINELAEAQKASLAARAGALAAAALAAPLVASVARALDLDVLEIRPGDEAASGPVVVVGRQVSDRLYVGFRHAFGSNTGNRLTLEYRLTEFLRILTSLAPGADPDRVRGRADTAGIDLILVIRRD